MTMGLLLIFCLFVFFGAVSMPIIAEPVEDKQALLDFFHNVRPGHSLNWNKSTSVCSSWVGVTCNGNLSRVIALRLPGMGIRGSIPLNTLGRLSEIHILSLRSNAISGSFPSELSKLENLTDLFLQFNNFSGSLPEDFSIWKDLRVLDLSNNGFNGSIPSSISNLTHLTSLNLSNNSLSGVIPDINTPSLQNLNLANNDLNGSVPQSLIRFPSWTFAGNNLSSEHEKPPKKTKKLSEPAILGIVIGGCLLVAFLMMCYYCKKDRGGKLPVKSERSLGALSKNDSEEQDKETKLVFFEDCRLAFDLEDLLRASAEVLGKGTLGTTYKAVLEDANILVVKRLKEMSVAKKEFEQQMQVTGSIRHPNISPLRAYYYSKDEKLTVYDYYEHGSISTMLHGKCGEGRIHLDWETRLKIAIGAARGLAYIHTETGGKLVHGNIKASNIFVNSEGYGCISEGGLATLINSEPLPITRGTGYRAPEIQGSSRVTHASDVYSFGVLLLELLTGKSPTNATGGGEVIHLVKWVHYVVNEEWTAEVFDVELLKYPNIEEEMLEMLRIGMNCVARMPESRPKMIDVVKTVEEVRRENTQNPQCLDTDAETAISTLTSPRALDFVSSFLPSLQ